MGGLYPHYQDILDNNAHETDHKKDIEQGKTSS